MLDEIFQELEFMCCQRYGLVRAPGAHPGKIDLAVAEGIGDHCRWLMPSTQEQPELAPLIRED